MHVHNPIVLDDNDVDFAMNMSALQLRQHKNRYPLRYNMQLIHDNSTVASITI